MALPLLPHLLECQCHGEERVPLLPPGMRSALHPPPADERKPPGQARDRRVRRRRRLRRMLLPKLRLMSGKRTVNINEPAIP